MHVFFSGIGGVGIGPLALIAHDSGVEVSGSDMAEGPVFEELSEAGISVQTGQSYEAIAELHAKNPIDWFVYSSALPEDHPELVFAREHKIRISKRHEFLNEILESAQLKLVAIAGTHGKTTTTAMVVWLFKQLGLPHSYSIGSQITFGPIGAYQLHSQYFIYECDEYDRNFLHFHPYMSLITAIDYDHPDTYPTEEDYQQAFRTFAGQSEWVMNWRQDDPIFDDLESDNRTTIDDDPRLNDITLPGAHNRRNAWLAIQAVSELTEQPVDKLIGLMNKFPGTSRRFERLAENIYSDYAHHPAEIRATLQLAKELGQEIVAVYQPHQNRRQHAVADDYQDCFEAAERVYWTPTYLTREDEDLPVLAPEALIAKLTSENAEPAELSDELAEKLKSAAKDGKLVLVMGAGPIDDWARTELA